MSDWVDWTWRSEGGADVFTWGKTVLAFRRGGIVVTVGAADRHWGRHEVVAYSRVRAVEVWITGVAILLANETDTIVVEPGGFFMRGLYSKADRRVGELALALAEAVADRVGNCEKEQTCLITS